MIFSSTRIVNIFLVMQVRTQKLSVVCFAIALFTAWVTIVEATTVTQKTESRIVHSAFALTEERIMKQLALE